MERGAVRTQRAKSSALKVLPHRIVPTRCLAKRSQSVRTCTRPRGLRDRAERGPIADPLTGSRVLAVFLGAPATRVMTTQLITVASCRTLAGVPAHLVDSVLAGDR
jgi:hypothetical protein